VVELLLNEIASILRRFVFLPPHAAETLALWVLHTYVFKLRDISTYIGIESSGKGCGKTTLLRVLGKLVQKPVSTANVSPSALFRVIEELQPTLLIDEGDTFLRNNDELRGILNAGYTPDTAFVLRASSEASVQSSVCSVQSSPSLKTENGTPNTSSKAGFRQFSTWCPKAIAMIGRLPETLGDRCIIIRMQKKSPAQKCERLRDLDVADLPARCAEFARHHADAIAKARPQIPTGLGDRAADIWEPLLVLADLASSGESSSSSFSSSTRSDSLFDVESSVLDIESSPNPRDIAPSRLCVKISESLRPPLSPLPVKSDSGAVAETPGSGHSSVYSAYSVVKNPGSVWPELARHAAIALSTAAQEQRPIVALLSDIQKIFTAAKTNRLFTRTIVQALNELPDRPWRDLGQSQRITSNWLSGQLRPYAIASKTMWINGKAAKGYDLEDFESVSKRVLSTD
jgi:hypothetical protein